MERKRTWLVLVCLVIGLMCTACTGQVDDTLAQDADADDTEALTLALGSGSLGLRGVNLAGAEFGNAVPGTRGRDYAYPTRAEVDYFLHKGMTVFRVPFMWERLQRQQLGELDSAELQALTDIVGYATGRGASVLIDPHNYARYQNSLIGSAQVPDRSFANLWTRLADRFKGDARVIFGLMNEPNTMPTEQWVRSANAAIAAIRATGAKNLILVPGNAWTGAHSWLDSWYGTPNAQAMLSVKDPIDNMAFEAHQYLDADSSGTNESCAGANVGDERMRAFTGWLRQHGKKGFLGEFGGGRNRTCYAALESLLSHLDKNADVYLGFTYWAAGPMWGEYIYTLEPSNGQDRPQMAVIARHLSFTPPAPAPNPSPAPPVTQPPPVNQPPAPPAPPTPPPSDGAPSLRTELSVTSEWTSGYCADVRIRNLGSSATQSWTVRVDHRGSPLSQLWNGLPAQSGSIYTVKNLDHNRNIAAGASTLFGFCADKDAAGHKAEVLSAH